MLFSLLPLSCSKELLPSYQHRNEFPLGVVLKFDLQAIQLIMVEERRSRLVQVLLLTHGSDTALVVNRNAPITDASCSLHCTRDNKAAGFIEPQVHQRDCNHRGTIERWD